MHVGWHSRLGKIRLWRGHSGCATPSPPRDGVPEGGTRAGWLIAAIHNANVERLYQLAKFDRSASGVTRAWWRQCEKRNLQCSTSLRLPPAAWLKRLGSHAYAQWVAALGITAPKGCCNRFSASSIRRCTCKSTPERAAAGLHRRPNAQCRLRAWPPGRWQRRLA